MSTYTLTLKTPSDADELRANGIAAQNDVGGTYTVEEAAQLAAELGANGELYDEAGFLRGWVKSDGNWRLA